MTRDPSKSRGVRNNNPGNIRRVRGQTWKGQSEQQTDSSFVQFRDPVYGIRALTVVLLNYYRRYGLDTVESIINRWAPPVENDTENYVQVVARRMNVAPDEPLDLYDSSVLMDLVTSIIWVETGGYEYPIEVVERGISMALAEPKPSLRLRDAARTDTGRGAVVAAATTAAGSVATVVSGLAELDWRVGIAVILALTMMAIVAVWAWRSRRD